MQTIAVELTTKLRDDIEAIRDHLTKLQAFDLQALEKRLPRDAPAGTAEMVMQVLVYREMDRRKR